jgi:hypothetical protein
VRERASEREKSERDRENERSRERDREKQERENTSRRDSERSRARAKESEREKKEERERERQRSRERARRARARARERERDRDRHTQSAQGNGFERRAPGLTYHRRRSADSDCGAKQAAAERARQAAANAGQGHAPGSGGGSRGQRRGESGTGQRWQTRPACGGERAGFSVCGCAWRVYVSGSMHALLSQVRAESVLRGAKAQDAGPSRNEAAAPVGPNCHDLAWNPSQVSRSTRDADNVFCIVFTSAVPWSL